jgi:4'-phosphopantetheinyl transferase
VWWADAVPVRLAGLAVLDSGERRRLAGCRFLADRDAFATAAVVLRTAVGGYLGLPPAAVRIDRRCNRCGQPHGVPRPRGEAGAYAVSVARSGRRVGVAVSHAGPVGLGLQRLAAPGLAPGDVLTAAELAGLRDLPERAQATAIATAWAAKQAVRRAAAPGTAPHPRDFAITPLGVRPGVINAGAGNPGEAPLLYGLHPAPGYAATLAVRGTAEADICEYDAAPLLSAESGAVRRRLAA